MKLKKFKEKNHKKKITIGITVILVLLVAGIIVYRSFAFYEEKKAFDVIKGQVPDQNYDLMFSFYVKDENGNNIYQETVPEGKDYTVTIECNNGATGEWDYEVWGPRITNLTKTRTKCKIIFEINDKVKLTDSAKIGDYVYYKPSKTSYTTNASYVGGSSYVTTINPSELTLWRIIKKNTDGSIQIVSENASSTVVKFYGQNGYKNFVGQLNLIAKQYEDSNYTIGSRYMGYLNQTQFAGNLSSTNTYGEQDYATDTNLVKAAIKTLVTKKVGTDTAVNYWLASRQCYINKLNNYYYDGRCVFTSGGIASSGNFCSSGGLYKKTEGTNTVGSNYIRPIVYLKSGLLVKGEGTKDNPWKVN